MSCTSLFSRFQKELQADVFLSPDGRSFCCIGVGEELVLQAHTSREEVRAFAFSDVCHRS